MLVFHDWMTLLNRGIDLQAVGSSDSHEVSRKIVGQGRTYIRVDDSDVSKINVDEAIEAMKRGSIQVSLGLLVNLRVNSRLAEGQVIPITADEIDVSVEVHGPSWCKATQVDLFANGTLVSSHAIDDKIATRPGLKVQWESTIKRPAHDIHLIAVARGDGAVGLHWPIAKPYQPTSKDWQPYLFGSSSLVKLDTDGDERWMSSMDYARQFLKNTVRMFLHC